MKRSFSCLACLLICLCITFIPNRSTAQQLVPINVAIQHALDNNLQVKQARYQRALSEQDLRQARMDFYPTLNAGASGGISWGLAFDQTTGRLIERTQLGSANGSLNTSFDIFNGNQRINQVRANKYQLLADDSNVERMKNDLILSVVTTYLEALTNQDLLTASQQQLELSTRQLEVVEANYEVGNNTLADLSQAKSQVATDELNVTASQNAFELSILNLKQQMELDPQTDIVLEKPVLPEVMRVSQTGVSASEVFQEAVLNFPDIKQSQYTSLVAQQNIKIAEAGYYPTLSFNGGIGTRYSSQAIDLIGSDPSKVPFGEQLRRNNNQSVGLTLNIPIFNNYRTKINVAKAKIAYENAIASEQLAKNNLNKVVNQAVLDLRSAEKRYKSAGFAFESARDAFEVIQQRFDVGLANSIELSTAQTNRNKAEFDLIQAKYDLLFRSKVIDFYLGNEINFEN